MHGLSELARLNEQRGRKLRQRLLETKALDLMRQALTLLDDTTMEGEEMATRNDALIIQARATIAEYDRLEAEAAAAA